MKKRTKKKRSSRYKKIDRRYAKAVHRRPLSKAEIARLGDKLMDALDLATAGHPKPYKRRIRRDHPEWFKK